MKTKNLTLKELDKLGLIDNFLLYYMPIKINKVKKFLCFKIRYKKNLLRNFEI